MEVFVCAFLKASDHFVFFKTSGHSAMHFLKRAVLSNHPPKKKALERGDFRRGFLKADYWKASLHHAAHASHTAHATHIRHCWGRFFFFDFMHGGFCG